MFKHLLLSLLFSVLSMSWGRGREEFPLAVSAVCSEVHPIPPRDIFQPPPGMGKENAVFGGAKTCCSKKRGQRKHSTRWSGTLHPVDSSAVVFAPRTGIRLAFLGVQVQHDGPILPCGDGGAQSDRPGRRRGARRERRFAFDPCLWTRNGWESMVLVVVVVVESVFASHKKREQFQHGRSLSATTTARRRQTTGRPPMRRVGWDKSHGHGRRNLRHRRPRLAATKPTVCLLPKVLPKKRKRLTYHDAAELALRPTCGYLRYCSARWPSFAR